jgi:hypothetical protein
MGIPNNQPVISDWNGDGKDGIGILLASNGIQKPDSNENHIREGSGMRLFWYVFNDKSVDGRY